MNLPYAVIGACFVMGVLHSYLRKRLWAKSYAESYLRNLADRSKVD